MTFSKAIGGVRAGAVIDANITGNTPLTAGPVFARYRSLVASAVIYSVAQSKNMSVSFNMVSDFEYIIGEEKLPFWVTVYTDDLGNGQILNTFRINTPAFQNISYYPGTLALYYTTPVYGHQEELYEARNASTAIEDFLEFQTTKNGGGSYHGRNGVCEFSRRDDTGDEELIAQSICLFSEVA
jgi:hypothetical protein